MRKSKRNRNQKGSIIEFAVSLPVIIFAVSLALNMGISLLAVRAVDLAARDAARAASLQQTKETAMAAAKAALMTHASSWVAPQLDEQAFVFDTAKVPSGTVYAGPGPIVVVSVKAGIDLPFKTMVDSAADRSKMNISRAYTFPIMKLPKFGPIVAQTGSPSV
jgi:hypothetical protein